MALRTALLYTALVQLLGQGIITDAEKLKDLPIKLSVDNKLSNEGNQLYSTTVVEGGVLLGAMRRLQTANSDFKFTVKDDPNFGFFLESVNGVAGKESDHTYWELLSEVNGVVTRLKTGVGCYVPTAHEHIILKFSTWSKNKEERP